MKAGTGGFGVSFTAPQVILFSADVERASAFYRRLGLDRLLIAWIEDPDGHPIQLVQRLGGDGR